MNRREFFKKIAAYGTGTVIFGIAVKSMANNIAKLQNMDWKGFINDRLKPQSEAIFKFMEQFVVEKTGWGKGGKPGRCPAGALNGMHALFEKMNVREGEFGVFTEPINNNYTVEAKEFFSLIADALDGNVLMKNGKVELLDFDAKGMETEIFSLEKGGFEMAATGAELAKLRKILAQSRGMVSVLS